MNPEQFLDYCGLIEGYKDFGPLRLRRAVVAYEAYSRAYGVTSLAGAGVAALRRPHKAVLRALMDRDEGLLPVLLVRE